MLVKDLQDLLQGSLYRIVDSSTHDILARSWSEDVSQYSDKEVKRMDAVIRNYSNEYYPIINVFI